jgi:hypothetical protein
MVSAIKASGATRYIDLLKAAGVDSSVRVCAVLLCYVCALRWPPGLHVNKQKPGRGAWNPSPRSLVTCMRHLFAKELGS